LDALSEFAAVFDRETGGELVRLKLSTGYDEHAAWPIHQPPHLWISGPFRAGSRLLELSLDPPSLSTVWNRKGMSNDVCSSVLVDGHVYGFDLRDVQSKAHRPTNGWFRCIELATGDVKWSNGSDTERRELGDESSTSLGHASVLHADGKLLLWNDTGDLILIRADPERCEELARIRVLGGSIGWTAPALIGSRGYLRSGFDEEEAREDEEERTIDTAVDGIRERFGIAALRRGSDLDRAS
jgi:hypothetical protein